MRKTLLKLDYAHSTVYIQNLKMYSLTEYLLYCTFTLLV